MEKKALMHENTVNFYWFGYWKLRAWMYALAFLFMFFIIFDRDDDKKKKRKSKFVRLHKTINMSGRKVIRKVRI